jgi:hypothetical protein
MTTRRFPLPWTVIEHAESFWVQDAGRQTVGWFLERRPSLIFSAKNCRLPGAYATCAVV